jgi:glycosyltransferase involved in cell wall biosynthesis
MKWMLAAPYELTLESGLWQTIKEYDASLEFIIEASQYSHNRSRPQSSMQDWTDYWQHSVKTWKNAQLNDAGIITSFPQLPVCVGIQKRFSLKPKPIIASTFNLGSLPGNIKKLLARSALKTITKFIVHSSAETINYSRYLNLPINRFEFIPLHKPLMEITAYENTEQPFILSMGSANRDYKTLFSAIKKTGYPLTVVAPTHALSGLTIPPSVTIKSNLSLSECRALVQQSRINIIPIDNETTASGQVTVIEAMMYRKPVIATDTIGTRDYISHEETGLLISPKSIPDLATAIDILWNNEKIRNNIATQAQSYVANELSHRKTAKRWIKILQNI